MNHTWRIPTTCLALLLLAGFAQTEAEAALFRPGAAPQETLPTAQTEIQPDPVVASLDAIGQPSGPPRLAESAEIASAPRMSGGDAASEAIFPGGTASTVGGLRVLEGITAARDPLQLLPPEPSVALAVPAPGAAGLLLGGALALAWLRSRRMRD